jgi:hypothetical protein
MIDRVTERIGRLGPVDDSESMAHNILAIWSSDRAAIAQEACQEARLYSWDHSMDALFGRVYPDALARSAQRSAVPGAALAGSLAKA